MEKRSVILRETFTLLFFTFTKVYGHSIIPYVAKYYLNFSTVIAFFFPLWSQGNSH